MVARKQINSHNEFRLATVTNRLIENGRVGWVSVFTDGCLTIENLRFIGTVKEEKAALPAIASSIAIMTIIKHFS